MDNNHEIYETILNKKFLKSVFTGYDTTDVDKFFDYVIEYLKENEKKVIDCEKNVIDLKKQIEKLNSDIKLKDNEIIKLNAIIQQYKDDGYDYLTNKTQQANVKKGEK